MNKHNEHVLHWRRVHQHRMDHWHPSGRDKANCTVKALQNAFGWSRVRAYHHNEKHGRKHGKGMLNDKWVKAIRGAAKKEGKQVTEHDACEYGKTVRTLEKALTPSEVVIVNVRRHTLSYNKRHTNDWACNRLIRVQEVLRIAS